MDKRFTILISITAAIVMCVAFSYAKKGEGVVEAEPVEFERARVEIVADGQMFTYDDEPIAPSDFTVAEEIEKRGINLSLDKKLDIVDEYLRCGADYKNALNVCFPRLVMFVNDIAEKSYKPSVDSRVVYENGKFKTTRHESGRKLDENALYCSVYYTVKYGTKERIKASTVEIAPNITQDELNKKLVLRGEYTTDFGTSTSMRASNIKLALSKIDGVCIEQGGILSFNGIVGERTEENGFKTAKVISDGKYVDGVGGGVCQASTAVYNAALRAGLKCVANAHSICPSYCEPGLDAMISSFSDLTISNNTDSPIYISARSNGYSATVKFFGVKNEYDKIVPESAVLYVDKFAETEWIDNEYKYFSNDTPSGDRLLVAPGRDGYTSETYLCYYIGGVMTKRDKIRTNVYKSSPQMVAIAP